MGTNYNNPIASRISLTSAPRFFLKIYLTSKLNLNIRDHHSVLEKVRSKLLSSDQSITSSKFSRDSFRVKYMRRPIKKIRLTEVTWSYSGQTSNYSDADFPPRQDKQLVLIETKRASIRIWLDFEAIQAQE